MSRCIYCFEDKPEDSYRKAEHVMPQSFGRFQNNFTLHGMVCDSCNHHLGNELETFLARDSLEGLSRVDHGIKKPRDFQYVRNSDRVVIRVAEGDLSGCYAVREYSEQEGRVILKYLPQVGFMMAPTGRYEYFLSSALPTKAELEDQGFDTVHPKAIFGVEIELDDLTRLLAEKGISFNRGKERPRGTSPPDVLVEVSITIDDRIWRGIAKIAFNYLAHCLGHDFALGPAFDPIRRYIRYGQKQDYPFVDAQQEAILAGEPIEGQRLLGHLVTLNRANDGVSIVSQVALFNRLTYRVSLARDFPDLTTPISRGNFFDVANLRILELGSTDGKQG
jgi:hypothetical protein